MPNPSRGPSDRFNRNRNDVCKGLSKFLRDAADRFENGEPVSCEGLERLNGVSHLIAIEAQKVAQSRNVDLDRCLGEVDECLPRLKKARLEPKEEPQEVNVEDSVWHLLSSSRGSGSAAAEADTLMTEGDAS